VGPDPLALDSLGRQLLLQPGARVASEQRSHENVATKGPCGASYVEPLAPAVCEKPTGLWIPPGRRCSTSKSLSIDGLAARQTIKSL
jgi:hypothetical protein